MATKTRGGRGGPATIAVGSVFAGYRIEALAGRGGMGTVYRARQIRPARQVALKVISPALAEDPDFRRRFEDESEIAASIEHPNVIPVYEVSESEGLLFIVMRYVDGTDLGHLIREGLSPARASRIVHQAAAALDSAHRSGLIHRDVKPANILIADANGDDHAYLTDFGLAKRTSSDEGPTQTGQWVGTLDYVAPEQIHGRGVDARVDVYSLACVLYQCLSGSVPYPRDSDVAKMFAHLNDPPPSLAEADATVPPEFEEVVHRGMSKAPDDRYPSAGDLGRAAVAASSGLLPSGEERSVAAGNAAPTVGAGEATRSAQAATQDDAATGPTDPLAATGGTEPLAATGAEALRSQRTRRRPGTTARGRMLRPAVALALAVAIIFLAAAAVLLTGGDPEPASAGTLVGDPIPVSTPSALELDEQSAWVANKADGTLTRIDQETGEVVDEIPAGDQPSGIAVGERFVWVSSLENGTVTRVDPRQGDVVGRPIPVGDGPANLAVGEGAVWTANYDDGTVTKIDEATGDVVGRPIRVGEGPIDVAAGEGAVWVANVEGDTLSRIHPRTGDVLGSPIPVGQSPESVAVGRGTVWVSSLLGDTVTRVDPLSNQIVGQPIPVGSRPDEVAVGDDAVWVANLDDNTVTRIDPALGEAVGEPILVGNGPGTVDIGTDYVWVGLFRAGALQRIEP